MRLNHDLNVGPGDAARCAIGVLLPVWFYSTGLITGVAAAMGLWSHTLNNVTAFIAVAVTASVEGLRRVVLATRPDGGRVPTAILRMIIMAMLALDLPILALLGADLRFNCFGNSCANDTQVALGLWLGICAVLLLTTPMAWRLLRRSAWLQPRGATQQAPST